MSDRRVWNRRAPVVARPSGWDETMGTLLAVLVFVAVVGLIGMTRASEDELQSHAFEHRRTPDPSPRDVHAVTGTLGSAPIPSWG